MSSRQISCHLSQRDQSTLPLDSLVETKMSAAPHAASPQGLMGSRGRVRKHGGCREEMGRSVFVWSALLSVFLSPPQRWEEQLYAALSFSSPPPSPPPPLHPSSALICSELHHKLLSPRCVNGTQPSAAVAGTEQQLPLACLSHRTTSSWPSELLVIFLD